MTVRQVVSIVCGWLFALSVGVLTFRLATAHNDFPVHYHPDEDGKVDQVLNRKRLNYHHPLLLLEATIQLRKAMGSETREELDVARQGRTVSALMVALGAVAITLAGWAAAGGWGLVTLGGVIGLCPPTIVYGHFMKEDAALAGGIGLVVLGVVLVLTGRRGYFRVAAAAFLGLACAVAVSGKVVGVTCLAAGAVVLVFGPLWNVRRWWHGAVEWTGRLLVFGACFAAGVVAINHRAFDFSGRWPAVRADAEESISGEIDHGTTGHSGLTLRKPNSFCLRTAVSEVTGPALPGAAAGAIALLATLWRRAMSALRGRRLDKGERQSPVDKQGPRPALPIAPFVTVAVLLICFAAVLSQNAIPFQRYALPITLLLHVLGGFGALLASRALTHCLAAGNGRWVRSVLLGGFVLLTVLLQGAECVRVTRAFRDDSRQRLWEFVAKLPAGTRIIADGYAGLQYGGDPFRFPAQGRPRVFPRVSMFGGAFASPEELGRRGFQYVVICAPTYERYLDPEVSSAGRWDDGFEQTRANYLKLLAMRPVWRSGQTHATHTFVDPEIRVIALRP